MEVGILTHLPHLELRRSSGNTVTTDDGGLDGFIPPSGTQAINGAQSARYTVRRRRKQPKPLTTQKPRQAEDAISRHTLVESWLATNEHLIERAFALDDGVTFHARFCAAADALREAKDAFR